MPPEGVVGHARAQSLRRRRGAGAAWRGRPRRARSSDGKPLMAWTRRRCNACGQVLVEEEAVVASCPACGAPVGMDSVIPETPPEPKDPVAAAHEPDEPSSESAPEPSLPHDWNLGEPMHRVFWFCLAAPDRVPLATMFRSLRWVFSMAWIGQVVLQMSFLMIGAAMLQAGAQELSLLREVSEAMSAYEQGGPEARRQRVAKEQMCTLTMLTPSSACSARCSQRLVRSEMSARRRRRVQAIEQRGPQHLDAWLRTLGDGLIALSRLFPCGACSVCASSQRLVNGAQGHGLWTGSPGPVRRR